MTRAIADTIEKDRRKAPLLAKLEAALTAGDITEAEIRELISGLPRMIRKAFELPDERILIAPGWEIVERQGGRDIAIVRAPD